jgi:hypothetical protein
LLALAAGAIAAAPGPKGAHIAAPTKRSKEPPALGAREIFIREQGRDLETLLYLGAIVLLTGMVAMSALLRWPAAYIDSSLPNAAQLTEKINNVATALTSVNAIFYSGLLAAIFAPAWLCVRRRAFYYANSIHEIRYGTWGELDAWLQRLDITLSPWRRVGSLIALLSPILIGLPITALLESLKR